MLTSIHFRLMGALCALALWFVLTGLNGCQGSAATMSEDNGFMSVHSADGPTSDGSTSCDPTRGQHDRECYWA